MGLLTLSAVVTASLTATITADPAHTFDLSIADQERDRLLFVPPPYPVNRTDSVHREQNGRVWVSRSPVGSRTPIPERIYGHPGAAAYGAPAELNALLLDVRADEDPIAISPWVEVGDEIKQELLTYRPWIDRSEREEILQDLERARILWLKEQGYIGKVRTHVNPNAESDDDSRTEIEPRGIIRKREPARLPSNVSAPAAPIQRVSLPPHMNPDIIAPFKVVETVEIDESPDAADKAEG